MNILVWIIFGAIVGWVASFIMNTRGRGLIRNIIVGLVGALIGGFLGSFIGIGSINTFTMEGFTVSLGGAVLFIWFIRSL